MERRGSGLKKIIESYEFEKNYKESLNPEFRSTRSSFFTILKNLNYNVHYEPQNEPQNEPQKMTRQDRWNKIIDIIANEPYITRLELSKKLNVAESTIKRDILKLKEEGKIEYIGGSKTGKWIKK